MKTPLTVIAQAAHRWRAGPWITALLLLSLLVAACQRTTVQVATATATTRPQATATQPAGATKPPAASPTAAGRTAAIAEMSGGVDARTSPQAAFAAAILGQLLPVGGGVRTDVTGLATLQLTEGTLIRVTQNTTFELLELGTDKTNPVTRLKLSLGRLLVAIGQTLGTGAFTIETPAGVASVRGSFVSVTYNTETGSADIVCLETSGSCTATVGGVTVTLQSGERTTVVGGQALPPQPVDQQDIQQFLAQLPNAGNIIPTVFPGGTPTQGPTRTPLPTLTPQPGFQPVTLCHATGDTLVPYVEITVDNQGALNGHQNHAADVIPVPVGGCPVAPGGPSATPQPTDTPTATVTPTATNTPRPPVPTDTPTATVPPPPTATATCVPGTVPCGP